jgi:hypothetical protein
MVSLLLAGTIIINSTRLRVSYVRNSRVMSSTNNNDDDNKRDNYLVDAAVGGTKRRRRQLWQRRSDDKMLSTSSLPPLKKRLLFRMETIEQQQPQSKRRGNVDIVAVATTNADNPDNPICTDFDADADYNARPTRHPFFQEACFHGPATSTMLIVKLPTWL